jgi:hypothetical protein
MVQRVVSRGLSSSYCNCCERGSGAYWRQLRKRESEVGQLFDEGLCMQLDSGQFGIPYCVFRLAADIDSSRLSSLPAKCMIQVLQYLRDHVDNVLFDKEPWQSWETFSACFFALRVNSLMFLGQKEALFSDLCRGAVANGCDMEVTLCPIEVHAIVECISPEVSKTVTDKLDGRKLNWLHGSKEGIRYCLLNGVELA